MADPVAEPVAAAPDFDQLNGGVQKLMNFMHYQARLHEQGGFKPSYDYANSGMQKSLQTLIADTMKPDATIPDAIRTAVTNLGTTCEATVESIKQNEFKKEDFQNPIDAIIKNIEAEKKALPAGTTNADLDRLSEELANFKNDALKQEFNQMRTNLQRQSDLDFESAQNILAMKASKDRGLFQHNDWKNESTDDLVNRKDGSGASTGEQLHSGADGMYAKPGSNYNVYISTNKDGTRVYEATYKGPPMGVFELIAQNVMQVATTGIKILGTLTGVIPLLEVASMMMAAVAKNLPGGGFELPHRQLFSTISGWDRNYKEPANNVREKCLAEIDVAVRRGKESDMVLTVADNAMGPEKLQKAVTMIQQLEKRAGFDASKSGPDRITDPQRAIGIKLTSTFHEELSKWINGGINYETKDIVKEFYKHQNGGKSDGFDIKNIREIILREVTLFQTAKAQMDQKFGKENGERPTTPGESDTSTIEVGKPKSTLTGTTAEMPAGQLGKEPSAPPEPTAAEQRSDILNKLKDLGVQINVDNREGHHVNHGDKGFDAAINDAVDKLHEIIEANKDVEGNPTPIGSLPEGVRDIAQGLVDNIDHAIELMSPAELVDAENQEMLETYKEAQVALGIEPPAYEAALGAGAAKGPAEEAPKGNTKLKHVLVEREAEPAPEAEAKLGAGAPRRP
jgi:hypothetical protein